MKYKVCKVCQTTKPTSEFPKRGNHRLNSCSICYSKQENEKFNKRYSEDPAFKLKRIQSGRKYQWRSKYNVSETEVYETLEKQNSKCANSGCGTPISLDPFLEFGKRAVLDHDHVSGNFRALLCDRCNVLLGHFEKNREVIYGLIDYADSFTNPKEN